MTRLFLDTSVLFAAVYSTQGHARDLFNLASKQEVVLVVSQDVIEEARYAFQQKAPHRLVIFEYLMRVVPFELVEPTKRQVLAAGKHVSDLKDAPIVSSLD